MWEELQQFPLLFASEEETTFLAFQRLLEDRTVQIITFHDEGHESLDGIATVSEVVPGIETQIQVSFFDQVLKGREKFVRQFVSWVFDTLGTERVSTQARADAKAMCAFLKRVGLYFEGALKRRVRKGNQWHDMYLFGLTQNECDEHWRKGHSWAKPRVKPSEKKPGQRVRHLEVYEVR